MTKENLEKVQNIITNNIYGSGNNVASGNNVEQNITKKNLIDYEKLQEFGVEEQHIEELKTIEKEPNKKILKERALSWFSKVSAAVAARGLYENIPAIMECVKSII